MVDEARLADSYNENLYKYKNLKKEAVYILEEYLKEKSIKIHSLPSRVKKIDDFINKVKRKEKDIKDPLKEVTDIVGLRVVCLFLSEIKKIGDAIRDCFEVLSEDNKIEGFEVDTFGYLSVHFVVKIKDTFSGPRYDKIKDMPFEIQVRTIAMDSWANISRQLDYRNKSAIPKELRRDFYALSGLFYVADTHFEMFFKQSQKSGTAMQEVFSKAVPDLDQEINLDSLRAYLEKTFPDKGGLDNPEDISELTFELKKYGCNTIKAVDNILNLTKKAFLEYEKEFQPAGAKGLYNAIGVVRISFTLYDDKFIEITFAGDQGTIDLRKSRVQKHRKLIEF